MHQSMRRVPTTGAGIKGQFCRVWIAAVPENVIPAAIVPRAGRFGTDAGGVIEQLLDRDLRLARITERLGPRDKLKRMVVEA